MITITSIEEDWRRENVSISGRLYSRKNSRFDRLHARKVSTFFPQTLMGGQQRGLVGSAFLPRALSLVQMSSSSVAENCLFLPAAITISARSNKLASKLPRL